MGALSKNRWISPTAENSITFVACHLIDYSQTLKICWRTFIEARAHYPAGARKD